MAPQSVDPELVRIALDKVEGFEFEQFANSFYSALVGWSFIPLGGMHDGGADAFTDDSVYERSGHPATFYQASIQDDHRAKIRGTIIRLRKFGRSPNTLVYVTSRAIKHIDVEEQNLSDELNVTIRIRDAVYVASHINEELGTREAFNVYLRHHTDYLKSVGASTIIPTSKYVTSPAVYVFLRQELERRNGDTSLLDALTDSLVLWALEGTDPDAGILMSRADVLSKVFKEMPSVCQLVEPRLKIRMEKLAKKEDGVERKVRWHRKQDLYCLPWETRKTIEQDNLADEALRIKVLDSFENRARTLTNNHLEPTATRLVASIVLRALQIAFEREGLEFSYFLQNKGEGSYPTIIDAIKAAIEEADLRDIPRQDIAEASFGTARAVLYSSDPDERAYLGKLSRTYALLFTLKTEPKLIEYFQDMTSDFHLYVGADILVRALSERYVPKSDQVIRNTLLMAARSGTRLSLAEPVLDEVLAHLRATDAEYRHYFEPVESSVTYEVARNAPKILIRSYYYARMNLEGETRPPANWPSYLQQFVWYSDLHKSAALEQLRRYFSATFGMEFESRDELERVTSHEEVTELAGKLVDMKADYRLAERDALLALAIYGKRDENREVARTSEFGFRTWWLTGETEILRHTHELVRNNRGARYMMRPDFLLNFMTLSPKANDVRTAFSNIFPSILGIRLAKRMDETAFHKIMEQFAEAEELEEGRRQAVLAELADKLKSDFARQYLIQIN